MRRGELLAGFDDDQSEAWSSWLNFERDRLRLAWRDAVLNRLASEIDTGEAIDLSARLLDADPLDEAALRTHMSWLARGGQSARARHAYHEFVSASPRTSGSRREPNCVRCTIRSERQCGPPICCIGSTAKSMKTLSGARSNYAGSAHCWRKTTAADMPDGSRGRRQDAARTACDP